MSNKLCQFHETGKHFRLFDFSSKNYFVREQQIIKTFESCQFHDRIIDGFECFLGPEIARVSAKLQIISRKSQNKVINNVKTKKI